MAYTPDTVRRVRELFVEHAFTTSGVANVLGAGAVAALQRDHPVPARRALVALSDASSSLIRLLLLGETLTDVEAIRYLGDAAHDLVELGLITTAGDNGRGESLKPVVRVQPFTTVTTGVDRWLVSDHLGARPLPDDHVLGLGGAANTLANLAIPDPVGRVLDLGTGSGVQLAQLASQAAHLVGTDTNARALRLAQLTLTLNGLEADLRQGDRFAPVGDERFDLIVSNPPLVIGPAARFEYRDSGLDGDAMCASITAQSTTHLTEGGYCQLLANWLHVRGQDWRERVAGWLPSDADAWVVQREVLDPAQYVEMWLADGGDVGTDAYNARYDGWLAWFEDQRIDAVGMGWISLRRTDAAPARRLEDLRQLVEQPVGPTARETLLNASWEHNLSDEGLLAAVLRLDANAELRQPLTRTTPTGWQPERPWIEQTGGLRRSAPIDAFGATVLGLLDGERTVSQVLVQACGALGIDPSEAAESALDAVRGLVQDGFVRPQRL